jgi:multidrug efflux system membrane fusion protein
MKLKSNLSKHIIKNHPLLYLITILPFALACLLTGCKDRTEVTVNAGKQPCIVEIYTVTAEKAQRTIELSGITEPVTQVTPAARVMARVLRADFHEGEKVKNGRTLVMLDTRDLETRKMQAQSGLATARHALEIASKNLGRKKDLFSTADIPLAELEMAQLAESQASSAVSAASAAVSELDVNLSYAVAKAPFSGTIVRKMTETGNMVAPGQPLFIIQDNSRIRIIAPVGTDLAALLKAGDKIAASIGNEKIEGIIEGVVSSGDVRAPGLRLQILIDNPGYRCQTGVLAIVKVPLGMKEEKRLTIPKDALVKFGQLSGVYIAGDDRMAHLRWLTINEDKDGSINVLTGLNEGERIILSPGKTGVYDGQSISVAHK